MAFIIWRITDGKAGHDSQSIGLCNAIEKLKSCQRFDIPINSFFDNYKNLLFKKFSLGVDSPSPNIIIGAGHGTHLSMICAKRARGGKTIVLMKPSLLLSLFDLCLIPEHDHPAKKDNVIITNGALNPVLYNQHKLANSGLILLGGPSKHYQWDNESLVNQIKQIVTNNLKVNWAIADSPRTPSSTLVSIGDLAYSNVDILNVVETDSETLRNSIFTSEQIWVSTDSVSMIYESLASGAAVGLLDVEQITKNRVSSAINTLIKEKQLSTFTIWNKTHKLINASIKFNEAERCAALLLDRGILA